MKYNSDLCVIPGGCTSKLQPADVSWKRPFKSHIAEMYDEWLFNEKTKGGNRRAPSKIVMLKWIYLGYINLVNAETCKTNN
jgi:hypothetical protein